MRFGIGAEVEFGFQKVAGIFGEGSEKGALWIKKRERERETVFLSFRFNFLGWRKKQRRERLDGWDLTATVEDWNGNGHVSLSHWAPHTHRRHGRVTWASESEKTYVRYNLLIYLSLSLANSILYKSFFDVNLHNLFSRITFSLPVFSSSSYFWR